MAKHHSLKFKILGYLSLVIFVLVFVEITSFLAGDFLERRFVIFYKARIDNEKILDTYKRYFSERHVVLGWPFKYWQAELRDESGSRIVPSFPDPDEHESCISSYGDSFTWGSGVEHEDTWGNILSEKIGCRVSNYGQPAYGTDQSYLRYELNTNDNAPIVFLGHLSNDILRNVSQNYDFILSPPTSGLRYKPRFILENGNIKLIPLPNFSEETYKKAVLYPEQYLPYEYFAPGGEAKISRLNFPYSWSILKSFIENPHLHSILMRRPYALDFYQESHNSEALQITTQIIESFDDLAKSRGKIPIVIIYPEVEDIRYYKKKGEWPYQNLINKMHIKNIQMINLGDEFLEYDEKVDIEKIFLSDSVARGHYNEEGNRITAEIIYNYLKSNKLF